MALAGVQVQCDPGGVAAVAALVGTLELLLQPGSSLTVLPLPLLAPTLGLSLKSFVLFLQGLLFSLDGGQLLLDN